MNFTWLGAECRPLPTNPSALRFVLRFGCLDALWPFRTCSRDAWWDQMFGAVRDHPSECSPGSRCVGRSSRHQGPSGNKKEAPAWPSAAAAPAGQAAWGAGPHTPLGLHGVGPDLPPRRARSPGWLWFVISPPQAPFDCCPFVLSVRGSVSLLFRLFISCSRFHTYVRSRGTRLSVSDLSHSAQHPSVCVRVHPCGGKGPESMFTTGGRFSVRTTPSSPSRPGGGLWGRVHVWAAATSVVCSGPPALGEGRCLRSPDGSSFPESAHHFTEPRARDLPTREPCRASSHPRRWAPAGLRPWVAQADPSVGRGVS